MYIYHYDYIGNMRVVQNTNPGSGSAVDALYDYTPYGKLSRKYESIGTQYLFTGKERDTETGIDYFDARNFDSDLGRFIQLDPHMSTYPSWSAYNYGSANPVFYNDPTGMDPNPLSGDGDKDKNTKEKVQSDKEKTFIQGFNKKTENSPQELTSTLNRYIDKPGEALTDALNATGSLLNSTGNFLLGRSSIGRDVIEAVKEAPNMSAYDWGQAFGGAASNLYKTTALTGGVGYVSGVGLTGAASSFMMNTAYMNNPFRIGGSVGPLDQWIRFGPSYSHTLDATTKFSIRWGASPARNFKYIKQIGSPPLQKVNIKLRNTTFPNIGGWRTNDPGHLHIIK